VFAAGRLDSLGTVPHIGVVQDGGEEEVEQHHNGKGVAGHVKGCGEGEPGVIDLGPVERDRQQSESRVHL
jgi:hypothetical protein